MRQTQESDFGFKDFKPKFVERTLGELEAEFNEGPFHLRHRCPACDSPKYHFAFQKGSFHYLECDACSSLYVQNIPKPEIWEIYREAVDQRLHDTPEYQEQTRKVAEEFCYKLELTISRLFQRNQPFAVGYAGLKNHLIAKRLAELFPNGSFQHIGPKDKRDSYDMVILNNRIESYPGGGESFYERLTSLKADGILYLTTRLGSGIDILTLWEQSRIHPLQHLNLFSIQGIRLMLDPGFHIKELSTPGVLDTEMILERDEVELPRFFQYMKRHGDSEIRQQFQSFVQQGRFSSFLVLVAQKKAFQESAEA